MHLKTTIAPEKNQSSPRRLPVHATYLSPWQDLLSYFVKYCENIYIINKNKLAFMIISHFSLYLCSGNLLYKQDSKEL